VGDVVEAIGIDNRDLHDDHVVADAAGLFGFVGDELVGEMRRLLDGRHFGGVEAGIDPHDHLAFGGEGAGFLGCGEAEGEAPADIAVALEFGEVRRRGDEGGKHRAALRAAAELHELDAVRGFGELLKIAGNFVVIGQFEVVAGRETEVLLGCGDRRAKSRK